MADKLFKATDKTEIVPIKPVQTLAFADRQIAILRAKILPVEPHLLLVDDPCPHVHLDSYQYRGTPFKSYEVRQLQYMTMVSDANRGIAHPKGDWHDDIEASSPAAIAARSQASMARATKEAKLPSKKISIADYKKMKKDRVAPSSRPTTAGGETHSRASSISSSEPMSRAPSFEIGLDNKEFSTEMNRNGELQNSFIRREDWKSCVPNTNHTVTNGKSANKNGHAPLSAKGPRDQISNKSELRNLSRDFPKHTLPPRPPSPRRNGDIKPYYVESRKRPLDYTSSTQTEKRAKADSTTSYSSPQGPVRNSALPVERRLSPARSTKLPAKPFLSSPQAKKDAAPKRIDTKNFTSSKSTPLPPLLSPLPADLENSPASASQPSISNSIKKLVPLTGSTSSRTNGSSDPNIVKKRQELSQLDTPPKSSSPPYVPPPLLSPNLPPIVERELLRLQKKTPNSISKLHENIRKPNALGVARTTPKVDHLPKKLHGESSNGETTKEKATLGKESLVVKLKYKKRRLKDLQRILNMTAKQSQEFLQLESKRLNNLRNRDVGVESSEDDVPLSKFVKTTPSVATPSRKRTSDMFEALSPPSKCLKSSNTDLAKPPAPLEPPFKSPAFSAPKQKNQLSTPKKPYGPKSTPPTAMRKVNSSDGVHPHTPGVSTPASAEKHPINASSTKPFVETRTRHEFSRYLAEGISLKRRMDAVLKNKTGITVKELPDRERKLGFCIAVECLLAYYCGFSLKEKGRAGSRIADWESAIKLWEFIVKPVDPYPFFHTLVLFIGALMKEELARSFVELGGDIEKVMWERVRKNAKDRDLCWAVADRNRSAIDAGDTTVNLGPWSTWREAREYVLMALGVFENREKVGWSIIVDV